MVPNVAAWTNIDDDDEGDEETGIEDPPATPHSSFFPFRPFIDGSKCLSDFPGNVTCLERELFDPDAPTVFVEEGGFGFFISLIMASFCFLTNSFSSLVFRRMPNASW